ncbi:hypothetical protein ACLQ2N_16265 [Streptomyces sp. DT224]|uniref:hypothetical protein n=1 Tax=Streptomyces sp. DT224 TaxID=3393426 RepID=UPI003CFA3D00
MTSDHRITKSRVRAESARLAAATEAAGSALHALVPEATAALVELNGPAYVVKVFAGDDEVDTSETGPFDWETLGEADALLRVGFELSDETLQAAGWEHVPDEETTSLYRITFPAHQQ